MIRATVLALLALGSPSIAQVVPTGTPAADILLSKAIAEHRVYLTCSSLDPATHARILDLWERDTAAAAKILAEQQVSTEIIAAFMKAADPAALMPGDDTPWVEVKGLCNTHPDWLEDYDRFNLTLLEIKLPAAFQ